MLAIVRDDAVCRRLMTVPSVGPLVAITYKSAMDDPNRITKSKAAGALFGLTPRKYQSGEKDVTSGITRAGLAARFKTSEGRPSAQDRCDPCIACGSMAQTYRWTEKQPIAAQA